MLTRRVRIKRHQNYRRCSKTKSPQVADTKNFLESLSNEVFYEIFDYLDGYEIYRAFSKLNIRFENLVNNGSFLMKVEFSATAVFNDDYEEFLRTNQYHIRSLHFFHEPILDKLIKFCMIDSLFNRLESLVLARISSFKFVVLLFYLQVLPRLFSLTVNLSYFYDELGDLYQIIFRLPFLKYLKMTISDYDQLDLSIPIAVDGQFSSIEYLVIYHHCSLDELTDLLSYTPRLSHLCCVNIAESEGEIKSEVLKKLTNLVHFTAASDDIDFDEFEEFLSKICSRLKLLSVKIESRDKTYLDSDRWERLIKKRMLYLDRFILCYTDVIDEDFEIGPCHSLLNGFTTPFWSEHRWILEILVKENGLFYVICPYKKSWIDSQEYLENPDDDYFPITHLFVGGALITEVDEPFIDEIYPIFDLIQLTCLDIECNEMSINMFIQILDHLPNLQFLRITDFPLAKLINISDSDLEIWENFVENNRIVQLTLRNVQSVEDLMDIIILFPRIQYLALGNVVGDDLQEILRCVLLQIQENDFSYLKTICFFSLEAEYNQLDKLKRMIDSENLLKKNYSIHRQLARFYLQWK